MRAWDRSTIGGVGASAADVRARRLELAAAMQRANDQVTAQVGRIGDATPGSWEASAKAWMDYGTDLAWRAANAPGDVGEAYVQRLDQTARTLGTLAKDALANGQDFLASSLQKGADTIVSVVDTVATGGAKALNSAVENFWGVPPIVFLLGGVAVLAGGGWLLLGTTGGQAVVGGALRAGAGAVGLGARGVAAYATGGATEIARAAL
jgi:hypothetical protein